MTWTMPPETAPQERIWMAFPRQGEVLGGTTSEQEEGYAAWADVAHAILDFEPVSMIVDPTEVPRARRMLSSDIEIVEKTIDDFWMRDSGPSFVLDEEGRLGAVDWVFNGWGAQPGVEYSHDAENARFIAEQLGVEVVPSLLVNEGGGFQIDREGTVLLTDTVQLDPGRNPFADRTRVEAELARTIGLKHAIWLPRGLTRDYEELGTRGHVDIVAALPEPGKVLLHRQADPDHPDHEVSRQLRTVLEGAIDASGLRLEVVDVPAPERLTDGIGFVDYSYINHLVVNGGVVACGFGEEKADARAREILAGAYPGRRVVSVDARELFARGGGIHCITQQQPRSGTS